MVVVVAQDKVCLCDFFLKHYLRPFYTLKKVDMNESYILLHSSFLFSWSCENQQKIVLQTAGYTSYSIFILAP